MFFILEQKSQKESKKIMELSEKDKEFIKSKNTINKASSKNFYIVIKEKYKENQKDEEKEFNERIIKNKLNENFFKIKEALSRCGNTTYEINKKSEVIEILNSFITAPKYNKEEG